MSFRPVFRFADEIEVCEVSWLWDGRVPVGSVTLLVGDPGVGKSLLAVEIAARVTRGGPQALSITAPVALAETAPMALPETAPAALRGPPGGVVYVSGEDGAEDALTPRLGAAGADLSRVCIVEGVAPEVEDRFGRRVAGEPEARVAFALPESLDALGEAIRTLTYPRLVVLDTLPALVRSGGVGLVGVLGELGALARSYSVAVLATTHLSKSEGRRAVYRVRGSLAYVAAARSVLAVSVDPCDPEARILHSLKSAYGPAAGALRFRIGDGPRVVWEGGVVGRPPADLLDLSAEGSSALAEACDWLEGAIGDGPRSAREMLREAGGLGIRPRTLTRAKRMLGVVSAWSGEEKAWVWVRSGGFGVQGSGKKSPRRHRDTEKK